MRRERGEGCWSGVRCEEGGGGVRDARMLTCSAACAFSPAVQLATCAGFTGLMAAIFVVIDVRLVGSHAEIVDLVTAMLMRTTLLPWTGFLGSRAVANLVRPCAAAVEVLEEHLSSTTGGGYQPVAQKDASS